LKRLKSNKIICITHIFLLIIINHQILLRFRRQHEQLRNVILRVFNSKVKAFTTGSSDENSIDEINNAFEEIKSVDIFNLSKEGTEEWFNVIKTYEDNIDRVEARIALRLRDQLAMAKNSNEMFRIFSLYNSLFVRPQIRGAIREYQTQLLQKVKFDIETLHAKFKVI
jgi:dynein heavy chain 1